LPSVLSTAKDDALDAVVAPVLQIMPELWELRVSPNLPLEHMKVDLPVTMCSPKRPDVATALIQPTLSSPERSVVTSTHPTLGDT
jgi:hypothetical protein